MTTANTPHRHQFIDPAQRRTAQRRHASKLSADRCVAQMRIAGCLDPDQLCAIRAAVLDCRQYWSARDGGFTLGAASYLDARQNRETYLTMSARYNTILVEKFSGLYDAVLAALQNALESKVTLADDVALPGFHVFESLSRGLPARTAHFDLQWMHALTDELPEATLSFTVPIELPAGGGWLWIWPLRYEDYEDSCAIGMSLVKYALSTPPRIWKYDAGALYFHDGFDLHAIGRADALAHSGRRLTLQGHGIRRDGVWYLYW